MNILFAIDGVLKGDKESTIRDGLVLYHALRANNQVTLLSNESYQDADRWLRINGLQDFDVLMGNEIELPGETVREAQIRVAKARGPVAMLVDPDPAVIATVYEHGIIGLLFVAPEFAAPQYRPDAPRKFRSWTDIEQAVDEHRLAKNNTKFVTDPHLQSDEGW